jgi:hypothetical protein
MTTFRYSEAELEAALEFARQIEPLEDPGTTSSFRSDSVLLTVWLALLVSAVLVEWVCEDARQELVEHAVTAGIVSGGLILGPLIFFGERFWARREREWTRELRFYEAFRLATLEAVDRFMDATRGALNTVDEFLIATAQRVGVVPQVNTQPVVEYMLETDLTWFREFSQTLQTAAVEVGTAAVQARPLMHMLASHRALVDEIDVVIFGLNRAVEASVAIAQCGDQMECDPERLAELFEELTDHRIAVLNQVLALHGRFRDLDPMYGFPAAIRDHLRSAGLR